VKFSTALPWAGPAGTADNLRTFATTAEALGFDHVKMGEHLVYPAVIDAPYPYTADGRMPPAPSGRRLEMLTTFAFLAGQTTRLRFQPGVLLLALRSPFSTAKAVATLDYLSGGRLTLEVGVGWMKDEYDIAGIPFGRRGAIVDEYLAALRLLFEDGVSEGGGGFAGSYLSFPPLIFEPKPVQRPIPVYIGSGAGRASLRRIARFGQGWTPIGLSADEVAAALPGLRKLLDEEGRDDRIQLELSLGHVDQSAPAAGDLLRRLERLAAVGATSVSVDFGIRSSPVIEDAIAAMRRFADVVMAQAADL